jgi:hypothetical protein
MSSSISQAFAIIKKHGLKLNKKLSLVCNTHGPTDDLLAFCLQFEDRVVVAAASLDEAAGLKAVNVSSARQAFSWASRGLCSVTNLATGESVCREALELFSNELPLSFDIEQRFCFLEVRPLLAAAESQEQAALEASFELMLSKVEAGRSQLVNLWCLREVLEAVRSPDFSFEQPAVARFAERLAVRLRDGEQLKHMFNNVFDIRSVRRERLLLEQALMHHLDKFEESVRPQLGGLFRVSNLVFVTPEYRGVAMAGGIATMVSDLCECLQRMGQNVTVIMPYYHTNR